VEEIKFVVQVMQSIGILVKLPIIVRVDKVGAIFMAENLTTSQRTKHVDIRYHFVQEFMEDGFIQINFCPDQEESCRHFYKEHQWAYS